MADTDTGWLGRLRSAVAAGGERRLEALALGGAVLAFVIVGLVGLAFFWDREVPLGGAGSLGEFGMVAAGVAALVAFVAAVFISRSLREMKRWYDWIDGIALAVAYAVIAVLSWALLADILQRGFIDATLYTLPAAALGASIAAVTAYLVIAGATHLDLEMLALVLALFLLEGVLAASLSANDAHWWEDNLSALGMVGESSALMFNVTVIVAGVLVTALARYATADLASTHPQGVRNVRLVLIGIGCCLMAVGLVPVNVSFWVHTGFASGMLALFAVLIVMLRRWLPSLARSFVILGWVFLGIAVVLVVFFAVGYYTLTAVELIAGIMVFAWIILFIRAVAAANADERSPRKTP